MNLPFSELCLLAFSQLNLSSNQIGGHYPPGGQSEDDFISTPEGPKPIADALKVNGSVTSVRLASELPRRALRSHSPLSLSLSLSDESRLLFASVCVLVFRAQINLSENFIGLEGAKAVGEALKDHGSMTRADVSFSKLDDESKSVLRNAIEGRSGFELTL